LTTVATLPGDVLHEDADDERRHREGVEVAGRRAGEHLRAGGVAREDRQAGEAEQQVEQVGEQAAHRAEDGAGQQHRERLQGQRDAGATHRDGRGVRRHRDERGEGGHQREVGGGEATAYGRRGGGVGHRHGVDFLVRS